MNTIRSWFKKLIYCWTYLDDLELHRVIAIFGALADCFDDGVD